MKPAWMELCIGKPPGGTENRRQGVTTFNSRGATHTAAEGGAKRAR